MFTSSTATCWSKWARSGTTWARAASPGCPGQFPHAFANASDSPVHFVGAVVPGGIEEYFAEQENCRGGEDFAEQSAYFSQLQGPPDPEQLAAIWAGHPGHIAGPPIEVDAAPAASRS